MERFINRINGQSITYDKLGNPLQYVDGKNFKWKDGRKLAEYTDKTNHIQYFYDSNNQRIKKIVNGMEITYNWDEESGLYYLLNRYYDSSMKRFLNADQFISLQEENLLSYGKNNPLKYIDPSGNVVETLVDIASGLYDFITLVKNPSWENLGYLAWDVGAVIVPFAPGSYATKAGKKVLQVADKASDFNDVSHLTVGSYSKLKKMFKGTKNVDVHHIIEKRFRKIGKLKHNGKRISSGKMMSVPLEKELHKMITKRWRTEIKYGTRYKDITKEKMRSAIQNVYHDMPALKKYALKYLKEVWK